MTDSKPESEREDTFFFKHSQQAVATLVDQICLFLKKNMEEQLLCSYTIFINLRD